MVRKALVAVAATATGGVGILAPWAFAPLAAADSDYVAFLSPSDNISCELDYRRSGLPDVTYCQSGSPPASVRMDPAGTLSICGGRARLGNAASGTPTLAYGQTMGTGPFTCRSETSGVTCTVVSGRGFTISSLGITPVG